MSTFCPVLATCPFCKTEFRAEVATSLQIRNLPEQRERILAGTFGQYLCPACGRQVSLEPALVYTDFDRNQAIATLPRRALRWRGALVPHVEAMFTRNLEVACPPMVREWAPHLRRRVVFGLPQLAEKLRIFDADLDDRVVEHLKLRILLDRNLLPHAARGELVFDALRDGALELRWTWPPVDGMGVDQGFKAGMQDYLRFAASERPAELAGILVDWRVFATPDEPLPEEERGTLAAVRG